MLKPVRSPGVWIALLFILVAAMGRAFEASGSQPGKNGSVPESSPTGSPSEGQLLVLNSQDSTVMVFDVPTYERLATIQVGKEPQEIVTTTDGRKAYVSSPREQSIAVIDLARRQVVRTLHSDSFHSPRGLAMTPDDRHLLLTSEDSRRFFLVDARRDVILRSLTTTQRSTHAVAILPGGRTAFAANAGSDTITMLRIPELRILRHLPVGDGPEGIDPSPNGRWVLVALQSADQVAILDAGSGASLARLPTGHLPVRVAITPNSFTALVSNRASNDVTVLDLLARRVKTTVAVGQKPGGLTTNRMGTRAYVTNSDSNTVSVISVPGFEVVNTIPVGGHPEGIAFVGAVDSAMKKRSKSS